MRFCESLHNEEKPISILKDTKDTLINFSEHTQVWFIGTDASLVPTASLCINIPEKP
jgi:hypothetical protein